MPQLSPALCAATFAALALASACVGESANPTRDLEDAIKSRAAALAKPVSLTSRELPDLPALSPRAASPIDLAFDASGVLATIDNANGAVFRMDATESSWRPVELRREITAPFAMTAAGVDIWVSESDGLHRFAPDGRLEESVVSQYAVYDFDSMPEDKLAVNPVLSGDSDDAILVTLDKTGRALDRWGERKAGAVGEIEGRSFVAACGGGNLVVGFVHTGALALIDGDRSVRWVTLPIPGRDGLDQLRQDKELIHPRPGMLRMPNYLAGVACEGSRAYVLLDMPQLTLVEVDRMTLTTRSFYGPAERTSRHYFRLTSSRSASQTRFATIAQDKSQRRIVEFVLRDE